MRIFTLVFYRFNIPDYKTISLPVEKSNSEAMELFHKETENGEYSLAETGEIVPQTITKTFVQHGKIKIEEISVSGYKFSLIQFCKDLLQKHSHYMRITINEEFLEMKKRSYGDFKKHW